MTGIDRYLRRDMKRVEGWLDTLTARIIADLGRHQTAGGLSGAVGEIGVHHGKLWLVLDHVAAPGETRFALDLFDLQDLNTDGSGRGSLDRFEANRRRFGSGTERVEIISASSLDVAPDDLAARIGPVRLFSVDGGHTADCTLNDLRLADRVLMDRGIVALDDVFNAGWPGVMTGFARYMGAEGRGLVPFAIVPGKVLLARPPAAAGFAAHLRERFGRYLLRSHDFFGREVPIFARPTGIPFRVRSAVHGTPLEHLARRAYHRFRR